MSELTSPLAGISRADWEQTPTALCALVPTLLAQSTTPPAHMQTVQAQVADLRGPPAPLLRQLLAAPLP